MKPFVLGPLAFALFVQFVNMNASFGYSSKTTFRYENLVTLIKERNLKSADDVIPLLPSTLRQNFTLMYDSQSLQRSTPLNPRAIVFGTDAKFIVTFGGDPTNPASKNLEIMQFNEDTKSFTLHEVSFENSLPHFASQTEIQNKCTSCHGARPRPIWSQYKHWFGAYGEHDDILSIKTSAEAPLPQWDDYQKFRSTTAQSPAFKSLFQGHEKDRSWPYSALYKSRSTATMPNFRFNLLLSMLSGKHIADRVAKSALFPHLKYNLLNNFFCATDDDSEDAAKSLLINFSSAPKEETNIDTVADWKLSAQNEKQWLRFFDIAYGATGLHLDRSEYRYATKTGLTPNGSFNHEIDTDDLAYLYIAKHVAETDPILRNAHSGEYSYSVFSRDSYKDPIFAGFTGALKASGLSGKFDPPCQHIKTKAAQEIQHAASSPTLNPQSRLREITPQNLQMNSGPELGERVLQNAGCIHCHNSGRAPLIHFDSRTLRGKSPVEVTSLISKIKYRISSPDPRERMPLGGRALTPSEQDSLLLYLKQLADGN